MLKNWWIVKSLTIVCLSTNKTLIINYFSFDWFYSGHIFEGELYSIYVMDVLKSMLFDWLCKSYIAMILISNDPKKV